MVFKYYEKDIIPDDRTGQACFDNSVILGYIMNKKTKLTVVRCNTCAKDTEMYPNPIFTTYEKYLKAGRKPCGCSNAARYDERQAQLMMMRFLPGFVVDLQGGYVGIRSVYKICCPVGHTFHATFNNVKQGQQHCPTCKREARKLNTRCQKEMQIKDHIKVQGLNYQYLNISNTDYSFSYLCPLHGVKQQKIYDFLSGNYCIECHGNATDTAYLLLISDKDTPVAVKYGVTGNVDNRLKYLNKRNLFKASVISVWKFKSHKEAVKAETEIKRIKKNYLSCREMKDGYTETASLLDIEWIESIYLKFGGIKEGA